MSKDLSCACGKPFIFTQVETTKSIGKEGICSCGLSVVILTHKSPLENAYSKKLLRSVHSKLRGIK